MSFRLVPSLRALLALALCGGLLTAIAPVVQAQQGYYELPTGFRQEFVAGGLDRPTSFAIAADGRIFVTEKAGKVRVIQAGELLPDPFIDLTNEVNDTADRGLLGIAVHPNWPNSPYLYLAYTYDPPEVTDRNPGGARVSRVLRLSADPNNLNAALPGSGQVIVGANSTAAHIGNPDAGDTEPFSCLDESGAPVQDCIAAEGTAHTIDDLAFGPDGALYVSTGDGIVNSKGNARALDINSLNGKVLRVDPMSGAGYGDNPFFDGDPNANRAKVFALGMRNPFRFAIHPRTGEVLVGDVGNNNWEEINRGGPGANFGWPCYEGGEEAATYANCDAFHSGAATLTAPIYFYPHTTEPQRGSAIGGDIYRGAAFPARYRGAYFFHDFNGGITFFMTFADDGSADVNEFGTNMPGIVKLVSAPDGALYVLSVIMGDLWRIRYEPGSNQPPAAVAGADVTDGQAPLTVNFTARGSSDPEGGRIAYAWDFGDGATASKANPSHTFAADGVYQVTLTVTDAAGAASSDTLAVTVGSAAPVAEILEPAAGAAFRIGDTVNLRGQGVDGEDGVLTGDRLQWQATLHHDEHLHYDAFKGTGEQGSFTLDDHGDDTYVELCLTVTDSQGLQDTACVDVKPEEVTYTFTTVPAGLPITYAGSRYKTPFKAVTYVNARRIVEAPAATPGGLAFAGWSDGGDAVHELLIQAEPQTLTAIYGDEPAPVAEDAAALAEAPVVTGTEAHTHADGAEQDAHEHAEAAPTATATPAPTPTAPSKPGGRKQGAGALLLERWDGISGDTVEDLTGAPAFKADQPSATAQLERLSFADGASEYGVRLRGYLHPPVTGAYRFFIAADDRGALLLSTDEDPANKVTIAYTPAWTGGREWDKFPEQASGAIQLEAGRRYYLEVLYKQGDQKDGLAVAWLPPAGEQEILEGAFLSPYQP